MRSDLKPYDENEKCPKCGGEFRCYHYPAEPDALISDRDTAFSFGIRCPGFSIPEFMGLTCARCHYQTARKPLDAKEESDAD